MGTQIWAGNAIRPDILPVGEPFDLGPILTAGSHDSLEDLAGKFGVTVAKLLQWNPDLASSAAAAMGRKLCELIHIQIHIVNIRIFQIASGDCD